MLVPSLSYPRDKDFWEAQESLPRDASGLETKQCLVKDIGFDANGGAWRVSSQPEGPCGVAQLSRIEKDQSDTSRMFWRHIARKAATNPVPLPGMSCSAIDQGEYVYDWKKTRSDHMQCEFVEFSPI
ncbi:hypothetical protein [Rhizobium ruizarguesonis]|uniref:hypothetical protein n=1 Tax=Rhizobium ruizarguesonis TaxID=2081791 RepID=UPI0015838E83|nr:hypothetical protein [Rhizobium ruizarguesonis]